MQEMNIHPDVDTYSTYILPTFPSVDSARVALKVMAWVYMSVLWYVTEYRCITWDEKDGLFTSEIFFVFVFLAKRRLEVCTETGIPCPVSAPYGKLFMGFILIP